MEFINTKIPDIYLIKPTIFTDNRGEFYESFRKDIFLKNGISFDFCQENKSFSKKNVFRGLHYQKPPFAQTKLVSCIKGKILDFAVDIRKNSPYFGQYFSVELSENNAFQLFIPKGFAHGFLALENSEICYKTDNYYCKEAEQIIHFSDDFLNIFSHKETKNFILSEKDENALTLHEIYQKEIHFY